MQASHDCFLFCFLFFFFLGHPNIFFFSFPIARPNQFFGKGKKKKNVPDELSDKHFFRLVSTIQEVYQLFITDFEIIVVYYIYERERVSFTITSMTCEGDPLLILVYIFCRFSRLQTLLF